MWQALVLEQTGDFLYYYADGDDNDIDYKDCKVLYKKWQFFVLGIDFLQSFVFYLKIEQRGK